MPDGVPEDVHPEFETNLVEEFVNQQGQAKCLYANRISYALDLKGPCQLTDTACSSALFMFNTAVNDLKLGLD